MGVSTQQPFLYRLARQLTFRVSSREMGEILADYREFSAAPDFSQPPKDVIRGLELSQKRPRRYAALGLAAVLANWWLLGWFVPHCGYTALRWAVPLGLGLGLPVLLFWGAGKKGALLAQTRRPTVFDRVFGVFVCFLSGLLLLSCLTGDYPRFQMNVIAAWVGPRSMVGTLHQALTAAMGLIAALCVWFFLSRGWNYYFPACCTGAAFYLLCAVYFLSTNMDIDPARAADPPAYYCAEVRAYALWAFACVAVGGICVLLARRRKGGGR